MNPIPRILIRGLFWVGLSTSLHAFQSTNPLTDSANPQEVFPIAYTDFVWFHPSLVTPIRVQVAEAWIAPIGFKKKAKQDVIHDVDFYFSMPGYWHRHIPIQRVFSKQPQETRKRQGIIHTFSLLNADGKVDRKNAVFIEIESERLGRARFHADIKKPDMFGRLVKWEMLNGRTITPETYSYERILDEKGYLRQYKNNRFLLDITQPDDGGVDINLYRLQDAYREGDKGLYSIREGAEPYNTELFRHPDPGQHSYLRLIHRVRGRTKDIYDIRIDHHEQLFTALERYPAYMFPILDPEGVAEQEEGKDPLGWRKKGEGLPEVGKRYEDQTQEPYFTHLYERAQGKDTYTAAIQQFYDDPGDPGSYQKESLRVSDGVFRHWRILRYDAKGRIEEVLNEMEGKPFSPPPTEPEPLQKASDRLTITYYDLEGETKDKISGITHWVGGQFVSRTWLRYGKDPDGAEIVQLERTEDPSAKQGNPRNTRETHYPNEFPGFELWE